MKPNKNAENSSEFAYKNKDADTYTPLYDIVFNTLKKLYTSYKPTMHNMHDPVIEGNFKLTGDTRVIPIVEHKDENIQLTCSTYISKGAGKPKTLKEAIMKPNGHLWKMSTISEVKNILSRRA